MNSDGTAYIINWVEEELPDFIQDLNPDSLRPNELPNAPEQESLQWETLYISGGRKDKISKGDIAGLFFKQGKLKADQLGVIEVKQDCAFVGVNSKVLDEVIELTNNRKLKKKKVRVSKI